VPGLPRHAPESTAPRAITFEDQAITDVAQWTVSDVRRWVDALQLTAATRTSRATWSARSAAACVPRGRGARLPEPRPRGADLSGGEAQRIRLAAQLGSNLQGVCYVLDEPTIGLHPRDNKILLNALRKLGEKGNTLVVVEHDEDTIRRADHIIDIGPGAGKRGGTLVAQGRRADLSAQSDSLTGQFLANPDRIRCSRGARSKPRPKCAARCRNSG
jgi:excinuclease ABC subunit A